MLRRYYDANQLLLDYLRGCQWKDLPRSLGAASTVHDRFSEWVEQGVFLGMWEVGLKQYADEAGIEWEWIAMDGAMVKAPSIAIHSH